jgi:hypothetical protein
MAGCRKAHPIHKCKEYTQKIIVNAKNTHKIHTGCVKFENRKHCFCVHLLVDPCICMHIYIGGSLATEEGTPRGSRSDQLRLAVSLSLSLSLFLSLSLCRSRSRARFSRSLCLSPSLYMPTVNNKIQYICAYDVNEPLGFTLMNVYLHSLWVRALIKSKQKCAERPLYDISLSVLYVRSFETAQ